MISGRVFFVHEGIHHPEFDVLDVLRLKVGILHSAHQSAPFCFGTGEAAVLRNLCGKVIRATLRGVEGEVEHAQTAGAGVAVLCLLRIKLAFIDLTYIVI